MKVNIHSKQVTTARRHVREALLDHGFGTPQHTVALEALNKLLAS